jgi:hypothetical protein
MFDKSQIPITNQNFAVSLNYSNVVASFALSDIYDMILILEQNGPDLYWYIQQNSNPGLLALIMPGYQPDSIDHAWISVLSNNPWGFVQSNVDEYLVFFYFDLNTLATIN